jgi:DNA-binding NarL/FixJ family response regulator
MENQSQEDKDAEKLKREEAEKLKKNDDEIKCLVAKGYKIPQIASSLGLTESHVLERMRILNIE